MAPEPSPRIPLFPLVPEARIAFRGYLSFRKTDAPFSFRSRGPRLDTRNRVGNPPLGAPEANCPLAASSLSFAICQSDFLLYDDENYVRDSDSDDSQNMCVHEKVSNTSEGAKELNIVSPTFGTSCLEPSKTDMVIGKLWGFLFFFCGNEAGC